MGPPGAIAHSRALLCPRASTLSPFLLRRSTLALRLGGSGSWQRSEFYAFLRRYGRRSGQPSSSSLARRACVHYSGCSAFYCTTPLVLVPFKFVYQDTLKFASAPGPFGGRGEMAMAVASSARLAFLVARCAPRRSTSDAVLLFPVQQQSIELPATTVGACRRRHCLRDCSFNSCSPRIVAGWFFILCRRDPLA